MCRNSYKKYDHLFSSIPDLRPHTESTIIPFLQFQIFDHTDACVTPVLSLSEAPAHPHNKHRCTFTPNPAGVICPSPAPQLSRTPGKSAINEPNPRAGQHSRQVLRHFGFTQEAIDVLIRDNVIECSETENSKL